MTPSQTTQSQLARRDGGGGGQGQTRRVSLIIVKSTETLRFITPLRFIPPCFGGVGAEGAEKILGYLTSTFEDFLHFCEVSEDKID